MKKIIRHPTVSLFLKFGFSAAILAYMVYSGRLDLAVVRGGFSQWHVVLLSLVLVIAGVLFSFVRWRYLLEGQGIVFPYSHVARYGLIGCFFNTTMPGAVSGDLIKAWYVVRENKKFERTPVFASILLDRVFGVFGLVSVATIALVLGWPVIWAIPKMRGVATIVMLLAFGMAVFFLYIMLSVWGPFAKLRSLMGGLEAYGPGRVLLKGYDAWMTYQKSPGILCKALLLSMATHVCAISAVISCAHALGVQSISYFNFFLLVPLGLLTTAVPVAPAGLGVGQVAFGSLFSLAGSDHGPEIFTLFVTFQILVNLTGVIFYIRASSHPTAAEAEAV